MLDPDLRNRPNGPLSPLTAQQTNLVRSVLGSTDDLQKATVTTRTAGRKNVEPLEAEELVRFCSAWQEAPIQCIRSMNEAIGALKGQNRRSRYLEAALDLELLMDREGQKRYTGQDLVGIPGYLADGYTDFGIYRARASARRRERIVVDKKGLRSGLVNSKRSAVQSMSQLRQSSGFANVLRELGVGLSRELGYEQETSKAPSGEDTIPLSASLERNNATCRHVAIVYQLRLQEAGISSRMEKGKLQLFSLKLRTAWNLAREGNVFALVDVAFGEGDVPLVILGSAPIDVYEKAAEHDRVYHPSPESYHRYQIRMHDDEPGADVDPTLLGRTAEPTMGSGAHRNP